MKAERGVSHGRSWPRSLARSLARRLPPILGPPAGSLRPPPPRAAGSGRTPSSPSAPAPRCWGPRRRAGPLSARPT
ncbi:hypothetical protein MC885_012219 [Smutsia gigantea]|nr:hypothetical protein MC885_012219 [Smutsia gigantea]